jgi:hypothetical protein
VWSDVEGGYVPQVIPAASLGYWIGPDTPDNSVYNFWIETDVGGSPLSLRTYYSGAWVDVYATTIAGYLTVAAAAATYKTIASFNTDIANYSTTAQMNTAITNALVPYLTSATAAATYLTIANAASTYAPLASPALTGTPTSPTAAPGTNTTQIATTAFVTAAIAAIPSVTIVAGQGIFRASPSANQDIVHGGAGSLTTDVALGTEGFDPDGNFAASIFTAPANGYYSFNATVQLSVFAGAPTDVDYYGIISASSGVSITMSGRDDTATGQAFSTGSGLIQLTTGQTVKLSVTSVADAACTVRIGSGGTFFSGTRIR